MSKSTAAKSTTPNPSIYQVVTDRIVESLKNGIIPWQKPWRAPTYAGRSFPRNFRTGKPYRGVNILLLWPMPYRAPSGSRSSKPRNLEALSAKERKAPDRLLQTAPRQSEADRGTAPKNTEEKGGHSPFVLAYHTVFNIEQCDGLKLPELLPSAQPNEVEIDEISEALVQSGAGAASTKAH